MRTHFSDKMTGKNQITTSIVCYNRAAFLPSDEFLLHLFMCCGLCDLDLWPRKHLI